MSSTTPDGPYESEEDLIDPGAAPPPDVEEQDDGQDPEPDEGAPEPEEDTL